jgi:hypothetical protein
LIALVVVVVNVVVVVVIVADDAEIDGDADDGLEVVAVAALVAETKAETGTGLGSEAVENEYLHEANDEWIVEAVVGVVAAESVAVDVVDDAAAAFEKEPFEPSRDDEQWLIEAFVVDVVVVGAEFDAVFAAVGLDDYRSSL